LRPGVADRLHQRLQLRVGQPIGEPEPAARATDPSQLVGHRAVVVSVDDSVSRRDDIERRVRVVEPFGIADLEVDAEALLHRQVTSCLDQLGRQVLARDPGTGACRAEGDGAGASGEVQPALTRARPQAGDQLVVYRKERRSAICCQDADPQMRAWSAFSAASAVTCGARAARCS
jgi:hypothetical protein